MKTNLRKRKCLETINILCEHHISDNKPREKIKRIFRRSGSIGMPFVNEEDALTLKVHVKSMMQVECFLGSKNN